MDVVAAVLFRGALAYYKIGEAVGKFEASLLSFKGLGERPPQLIKFEKIGRHCTGTADVDLMDDLWDALERRKSGNSSLVMF